MAKKLKDKVTKPQTVKELKAWLYGILEFQDDKWIPNEQQWKSIKEKLFNLKEDVEIIQYSGNNLPNIPPHNTDISRSNQMPMQPHVNGASLNPQPNSHKRITLLPEGDGPIEVIDIPVADMTNLMNLPNQSIPQIPNVENISSTIKVSGKKFKTPDDLSGQPYKSKFF